MIKQWRFEKKLFLGNIDKRWAYETEVFEATGDDINEVKEAVIDQVDYRIKELEAQCGANSNKVEKIKA
jgi:hypothetical protein